MVHFLPNVPFQGRRITIWQGLRELNGNKWSAWKMNVEWRVQSDRITLAYLSRTFSGLLPLRETAEHFLAFPLQMAASESMM